MLLPVLLAVLPVPAQAEDALAALQAVLADASLADDYEALREAATAARDAGKSGAAVSQAEQRLKEMAKTALNATMQDPVDLDQLVEAIQRARFEGVTASQVTAAEGARDKALKARLAMALAADDIRLLCALLSFADARGGPSLASDASAARTKLRARLTATLAGASGLVATHPGRLQAAVDCGPAEGANASSVEAAAALLRAASWKERTREAIQEAKDAKDWWALVVAVAEARRAGVPNTELMSSVAQYTSMARMQALAAANSSVELDDVRAALQLGEAANVSATVLAPLRQRLAAAEKEKLRTAETAEDLHQMQDALQSAVHVNDSERSVAASKLGALLSKKLKAATSANASLKLKDLADLLDFALHGNVAYTNDDAQKAAKRFLKSLEDELRQAVTMDQLEAVTDVAAACDDCLYLALGDNTSAHEEYGRIVTDARDKRDREWGKAVVMEGLEEAATARNPVAIREAINRCKAVGCALFDLMQFETQAKNFEAAQAAAKTKLHAAVKSKSKESLSQAIDEAVLAGLDTVEPHVLMSARSALTGF